MNNQCLLFVTFFMFYVTFFICYHLALVFIDLSPPLKQTLLPALIASVIGYISKICLSISAPVHTIVVVVICMGILYFFNQINIIFSLIGSLLTVITLTLGSLILACPLFIKLGYEVPFKYNGVVWLFLNMLELFVPALVLIILKISKFSLIKYLYVK